MATPSQKITDGKPARNDVTEEYDDHVLTPEQLNELSRMHIAHRLGFSVEQLKQEGYFD